MLKDILRLLFLPLIAMALGACADEFEFGRVPGGEGTANIRATVTFTPLVTQTLGTAADSRAPGDALQALNDLTIFLYSPNGQDAQGNTIYSLVKIASGDDLLNYNADKTNTQTPADPDKKAEATTMEASFTIADIPYGNYHIYALANAGSFVDDEATREQFSTEDRLKEYSVAWNPDNISANAQMFGYFSTERYVDATDGKYEVDSFDAPTVTIDKTDITIYAWVARAASKVTIAFDGSGLENDIWVYIKNVTIHDIPRTCPVGAPNTPSSNDELIADGETLNYNQDGVITDGSAQSESYDQWLEISKGSGVKGVTFNPDDAGNIGKDSRHDESTPALYFYENLQGNFEDRPDKALFDKAMNPDSVGTNVWQAGQPGYKDNVPYGTYIEVEAYYVSHNTRDLTRGRIIYRYMLGQNDQYDYNASRNRHYQLTLGFRGFANQPDWHINYYEPPIAMYFDAPYHISYIYNHKATFPIRIVGDVSELEVEIVENNWAPFDSLTTQGAPPYMHIPLESFGLAASDFKWARQVYVNSGKMDVTKYSQYTNKPSDEVVFDQTIVNQSGFFYGLQRPYDSNGVEQIKYSDTDIKRGAPEYVTPIWAGFLALNVPDDLKVVILEGDTWNKPSGLLALKNYYYNNKQNIRVFTKDDLTFSENQTSKVVGSGNNACTIHKNEDGSITIDLPMWTRQKSMLGISGFSGNNPYDTYQRRAKVRVTAKYANLKPIPKKITHFVPVYQVRRIVNPKAVWRAWNDAKSFEVTLMHREGASTTDPFDSFKSEGAWRASIRIGSDFMSLSGGNAVDGNAIVGFTDTPINFTIHFNGPLSSESEVKCGIIDVEYNGLTCDHTIFVRQGYNEPLDVAGDGVRWSSFNLFSCDDPDIPLGQTWDSNTKNYINATLTKSPLSIGSYFKRANYYGILEENNETYGLRENIGSNGNGTLLLTNGSSTWKNVQGYPYYQSFNVWSGKAIPAGNPQPTFSWGRFHVNINHQMRHYRVPTIEEYEHLHTMTDLGIGILYGDNATATTKNVDDAYGFTDYNNDGYDDSGEGNIGVRGMIVYNQNNANQIFFPVGKYGAGRRTIIYGSQFSAVGAGQLRYTRLLEVLNIYNDAGRPIPYNMPASPGALYWVNTVSSSNAAWDCNYFDINFEPFSAQVCMPPSYSGETQDFLWTHGGDAIPIKLVLDTDEPTHEEGYVDK